MEILAPICEHGWPALLVDLDEKLVQEPQGGPWTALALRHGLVGPGWKIPMAQDPCKTCSRTEPVRVPYRVGTGPAVVGFAPGRLNSHGVPKTVPCAVPGCLLFIAEGEPHASPCMFPAPPPEKGKT